MRVLTGEIEDTIPTPESEGKDPAAVMLGRKGGKARAESLSKKRRKEIAQKAVHARWKEPRPRPYRTSRNRTPGTTGFADKS
jgi:hypothetical protein